MHENSINSTVQAVPHYRVAIPVEHLGWVDLDLGVPMAGEAGEGGASQIWAKTTKVYDWNATKWLVRRRTNEIDDCWIGRVSCHFYKFPFHWYFPFPWKQFHKITECGSTHIYTYPVLYYWVKEKLNSVFWAVMYTWTWRHTIKPSLTRKCGHKHFSGRLILNSSSSYNHARQR